MRALFRRSAFSVLIWQEDGWESPDPDASSPLLKTPKHMALLLIRLLFLASITGLVVSLLAGLAGRKRGNPPRRLWRWLGGISFAVLLIMNVGVYIIASGMH